MFLTARWTHLLLLSYRVRPDVLHPHLPPRAVLDRFDGDAVVSLVAFRFQDTRVKGIAVPFHRDFTEVNLRTYVSVDGHRGVVFIRELVPRRAIVWVARAFYNEPYAYCRLSSRTVETGDDVQVRYDMGRGETRSFVEAHGMGLALPDPASLEHRLKEHDRGFGVSASKQLLSYAVRHPIWRVWRTIRVQRQVRFGALFGPAWAFLEREDPANLMLAEGSTVEVGEPVRPSG